MHTLMRERAESISREISIHIKLTIKLGRHKRGAEIARRAGLKCDFLHWEENIDDCNFKPLYLQLRLHIFNGDMLSV